MALRESRRFAYLNTLLSSITPVNICATAEGVHLKLCIDLAMHCYQKATSALKKPAIRTLTHLLPRKTCDPLVMGFRHRISADTITHAIKLPPEVLDSVIRLQTTMGAIVLVERLRQLFTDLQPVTDPLLLKWQCRKSVTYNSTYLVDAVRRHAKEWGFNGRNLVKAYTSIGIQDPSLTGHKLELPLIPAPPPLLCSADALDEPSDFLPSLEDDGARRMPVSWAWVLPEITSPACELEEEALTQTVVHCWDLLEKREADDPWMDSESQTNKTASFVEDREQLEQLELGEALLCDLLVN